MESETKKTAKKDFNEETVSFSVPIDTTPRRSKTLTLSLNGKNIDLPRGEIVEIPRKYALLLNKKAQLRSFDRDYKDKLQKAIDDMA